jgi:hypothetical protein
MDDQAAQPVSETPTNTENPTGENQSSAIPSENGTTTTETKTDSAGEIIKAEEPQNDSSKTDKTTVCLHLRSDYKLLNPIHHF